MKNKRVKISQEILDIIKRDSSIIDGKFANSKNNVNSLVFERLF